MGSIILLFLFLGIIIIVFLILFLIIYNSLVMLKNHVSKAWSNIDVLLKQRYEELPKLVETVKGYMKYESNLFKDITKARASYNNSKNLKEVVQSNELITSTLNSIFIAVENYPNLKANTNFQKLQLRISELEDMIADRREFFNDCVTTYNTRIQQIPYNFFAKILNYKIKKLFDIKEFEKKKINLDL